MLGAAKVKETKIIGTTAEGDRVAIESRGNFEFEDGRVYRNSYHHLFIVRDNQVVKVHEYLDTALTARVFQQIGRASCRESVSVRVDLGGRRIIKKKNTPNTCSNYKKRET